jgi:hypothetical protein
MLFLGIRVTVGHTGLLLNDMYWVTIICKRPNDRRGNSSNVTANFIYTGFPIAKPLTARYVSLCCKSNPVYAINVTCSIAFLKN